MWEIFSKGGSPYHGMSNSQAREQIDKGIKHFSLSFSCFNEVSIIFLLVTLVNVKVINN